MDYKINPRKKWIFRISTRHDFRGKNGTEYQVGIIFSIHMNFHWPQREFERMKMDTVRDALTHTHAHTNLNIGIGNKIWNEIVYPPGRIYVGEAAHCAGAFIDFMDSFPFAFSPCCVAVVYGILWKLYDLSYNTHILVVYVNFDSSMRENRLNLFSSFCCSTLNCTATRAHRSIWDIRWHQLALSVHVNKTFLCTKQQKERGRERACRRNMTIAIN